MISNSDYLDPEGFSAPPQTSEKFPVLSDRCYYCRVSDSAGNWLIYNKVVNGWVCELCADDIINRKNQIIQGGK